MSLTTLFFGQRKTTSFGFFQADVLKSERIDMKATVTKHPVELGFEISDHIILQPFQIAAELYISEQHVSGGAGSRVANAYELLKLQRATKLPFSYVSNLEVFPFCYAEEISAPRSSMDGDSITFSLKIQPVVVLPPLGVPLPVDIVSPVALATVASLVTL